MDKFSRTTSILATFFGLTTLVIGPWFLGSYYGEHRLPLLYCATLTSLFTFLSTLLHPKKSHASKWLVVLPVIILCALGVFMWHNAWGSLHVDITKKEFYSGWKLTPLEKQPFTHLPGSADAGEAFDRLSYILPALGYLLSLAALLNRRIISVKPIFQTIFWTGVSIAVLGLLQRLTEAEAIFWCDDLFNVYRTLFFATFRSPGIASCYLNLCLALGLSHLLATMHSLSKKKRATPTQPILIIVGSILILSAAITAGSKAGAALTGLTVLLWLLFNLKGIFNLVRNASSLFPSGSPLERNIIVLAIVGALTLATFSFGELVYQRWEQAKDRDFSTLETRMLANEVQLDMITDPQWSPVAGFGPGSFYPMFPFYIRGREIHETLVYAHNDHLQTLVEWGWLGFSCFTIIIGGAGLILILESFLKKRQHRTANLYHFRGCAIAILICLLHATVDFPFQIESIAITFAALLGIAWAAPNLRKPPKNE